jgi:phosphoglycerate dehydrogenase-like enzyme
MTTLGRDATGKTIGIIGLGYIGAEVARIAKAAFDMTVLAYDPYVDDARMADAGARRAEVDEILRTADVVTLHLPLNPSTRHFVGKADLATMKPGAVLINAARGPIVDEFALADALREGRISGAAVDTFEQEPPAADHPLFGLPNCIVTPHFAGVTQESLVKLQMSAADAIKALVHRQRPAHIANPEAWPPARWKST